MKENRNRIYKLVFTALMAAVVCVVTFWRFPLLGSKVHFANAMCLLSGLLFGPVTGGVAAGLGSALYDALWGGYDIAQVLITFASKFAMAAICALIAGTFRARKGEEKPMRIVAGCVVGALSYVALYMLKTFVYQAFVYGYPMDTVWATMLSKLPASLMNAVFAMIVTPILYGALWKSLQRTDFLERLR